MKKKSSLRKMLVVRSIVIFLAGMLTMFLLMIFIVSVSSIDEESLELEDEQTIEGITLFEDSKEEPITSNKQLNVVSCLKDNVAIVQSGVKPKEMLMLLMGEDGELFYDNQKIDIPNGKITRQIGVYQYDDDEGGTKTIPVVKIK